MDRPHIVVVDARDLKEVVQEAIREALQSAPPLLAAPQTASPAHPPERRLLSLSKAAKMLGLSRGRTLPALIKEKRIRTVVVNGRTKIPLSEVERVSEEGDARVLSSGREPRRTRAAWGKAPSAADEAAKMAAATDEAARRH